MPPTYSWQLLRAGPLRLDGGSMFGVVPKVLWSKFAPPDDLNRIALGHNCLLLRRVDDESGRLVVIEVGSGNKFDEKMRSIFGLSSRWIGEALNEHGVKAEDVKDVIVSHLHFDHAGGLTRLARDGEKPDWKSRPSTGSGELRVKLTFPSARVHVQKREWEDAIANNSVMTRTYLREHLEPLREQLHLVSSSRPFPPASIPKRRDAPKLPLGSRSTQVLPGIDVFLVPGHTWGQQAIRFTDDRGRTVVFTPDVMPTVHHVGQAYNMAYDVEPYVTMMTKRWFLEAAARNNWLLVLDHEPGNPLQRVRPDDHGWYKLVPESDAVPRTTALQPVQTARK